MGGSKVGAPEHLIIKGKRLDGRTPGDFRPITTDVGVLSHAKGSAVFRFGNTWAMAGVMGPHEMHPKGLQDPANATLRTRYFMAPFSTWERSRPGMSRRSTEISKVIKEAMQQVLFLEEYPKTAIDLYMEILQADASTRIAAINAASMAMADAGIPMRDLISAVSVGRADGVLILDVAGLEDNFGDVDMAVATVADKDQFVLLQVDGIITRKEFETLLGMARKGIAEVYRKQKEALIRRYPGATMEAVQ
jgi:exosome complex component RRP41